MVAWAESKMFVGMIPGLVELTMAVVCLLDAPVQLASSRAIWNLMTATITGAMKRTSYWLLEERIQNNKVENIRSIQLQDHFCCW